MFVTVWGGCSMQRSNPWWLAAGVALALTLACSGGPSPEARGPAPAAPSPGAGVTGSSAGAPAAPTVPPPRAAVRIGVPAGLAFPLSLAIERGYFLEEGIDLERIDLASAADAMPPLSTGELDVGSGSLSAAFFNALARGIRLYLVLDAAHLEPGAGNLPLVVRPGPPGERAPRLGDLRGQRLAQPARGVITEWALDRMLAEVDMTVDDVEVVLMPFPDMFTALANGNIYGAVLPEPFATLSELRGVGWRARETSDYLPGAVLAVTMFSERFARERQDVARRWSVAYLRGGRDYMDTIEYGRDREATFALLARASGLDPQVVERMGHYAVARDGRVNVEAVFAMLDWLVQRGYVPQRPDLQPLLDPQFATYAQQTLDARH